MNAVFKFEWFYFSNKVMFAQTNVFYPVWTSWVLALFSIDPHGRFCSRHFLAWWQDLENQKTIGPVKKDPKYFCENLEFDINKTIFLFVHLMRVSKTILESQFKWYKSYVLNNFGNRLNIDSIVHQDQLLKLVITDIVRLSITNDHYH